MKTPSKKGLDILGNIVKKELTNILSIEVVPEVKDIIINSYNINLNDVVKDRRSKIRPEDYLLEFSDRLDSFNFFKKKENGVTFVTPDMENFDFSGRLSVIQTILEGTVGNYYEVSGEDYRRLTGKNPISKESIDSTLPIKDRVYLLRSTDPVVKKAEVEFGKKYLVPYAFSNTPPIDIMIDAQRFVDNNMDYWIDSAIKMANKEFISIYDGGKF